MHWLDVVRYADTCGFHGDNAFPAWPYRDYVLHAFRDNKPFDAVHARTTGGRPDSGRDSRAARGVGVQPSESHVGGRRTCSRRSIWRSTRRTACARRGRGLDGQHAGLRRMPRPQVRPVHVARFLLDEGVLRRHQGDRPGAGSRARTWGSQLALPTPEQEKQVESLRAQLASRAREAWRRKMKSLEPQARGVGKAAAGALRGGRSGVARAASAFAPNRRTAPC